MSLYETSETAPTSDLKTVSLVLLGVKLGKLYFFNKMESVMLREKNGRNRASLTIYLESKKIILNLF